VYFLATGPSDDVVHVPKFDAAARHDRDSIAGVIDQSRD
jgi:hypothetical protein